MGADNPLAPRSVASYPVALGRVKAWVRATLRLPEDALVSVSELACHAEGCPPRETVILVMRGTERPTALRIHKAMPDVGEPDVRAAASGQCVAEPQGAIVEEHAK